MTFDPEELGLYILEGETVRLAKSLEEYAEFFESGKRVIAQDKLGDGVFLSTVFLCIDHSFCSTKGHVLFETMIFGGESNEDQRRYQTYEAAITGHNEWLAVLKKSAKKYISKN